ncbi:sugar-binding domain-containing protein [Fulvivirga ligni]|uniref:sugar-binding domain-containing protein n=1 Tax=Fulvivirga ligni TaxID=2904246 RepID=UPI001F30685D|nr:sugar-binding domain-containing protein [Fulvivirga ligni]UII19866.1 hypothetical protein LVD16_18650 [Fulvivirga ligni]
MTKPTYLLLFFLSILLSCSEDKPQRARIDLSGSWQFAVDTATEGIDQQWFMQTLNDSVNLPGTTDTNKKGIVNTDTTTMHLNRRYIYEGAAWYRKKVHIPADFQGKHLELSLERSKVSQVWVDSIWVGSSKLLQSPQKFNVTNVLTPGDHYIAIMVNNDLSLTPYGNVHIYSDDTQTNWNGILGDIFIEASLDLRITHLKVIPDVKNKSFNAIIKIDNPLKINDLKIELEVQKIHNGKTEALSSIGKDIQSTDEVTISYELGDDADLWDEYQQPLYQVRAVISNNDMEDAQTTTFGMRDFKVQGTQFTINGRTTFLRGKHEAAVFPLTGYPPMDVAEWQKVYRIAKNYGINHYRFHTYCPPEAAFAAADLEGIYLQAELPFWGGLESDTVAEAQLKEGMAMLDAYGNHPSFVMFSPGNEIWSGHDRVEKNIKALKAYDSRPLYTMGSNNNIGYVGPREVSDFFVGARTPYEHDSMLTHTRLTHAFADSEQGGMLNTQTPSTQITFDYAVNHMDIPIVSHEIGQYQIYPNYIEIEKYTGVLEARNLEVFKRRLAAAGMVGMDSAFQRASGAWSALCYKAEMEAALRTQSMAGFQLLDLQDFPGQGTALVGILDAFMDSKNVITPEKWKESCNDVVLLLEMPKYCYTSTESFKAKVMVANYSNKAISETLQWELKNEAGDILHQGTLAHSITKQGVIDLADINFDFLKIHTAQKLSLELSLSGYTNSYPIWVYPKTEAPANEVLVSKRLDSKTLSQLSAGRSILLFPQTADVADKSLPGHFPSDFWNYGMFKGISEWVKKPVSPGTLGLLMNPEHPIFNSFPTDFHTNWQWFSIIKASNSLILDSTSHDYRPIIQVIDNLERNHKLGFIFEFKVGRGRLLVCMSDLERIKEKPEAAQLYTSILQYMDSDDFNPENEINANDLKKLL